MKTSWIPILATLLLGTSMSAAADPAHLVKDINTGLDPYDPSSGTGSLGYTPVGGRVVFFGFLREGDPAFNQLRCGLWATDGTAGGTERLADPCGDVPDFNDSKLRMVATTGAVAFFADFQGRLWRTDGTAAGTFPLRGIEVGGEPFDPPVIGPDGRTLFFSGCNPLSGCEPWRSDGTVAGTRRLRDVQPGAVSSSPTGFTVDGDRVLFAAGADLWSTDGTSAGTVRLVQTSGAVRKPVPEGGLVYFISSTRTDDVWVYDPASRTARKLKSFPTDFFRVGAALREAAGRVLIEPYDSEQGILSLWEALGRGTRPIGPPFTFHSGLDAFFAVGGRVAFPADGRLWTLDAGATRPRPIAGGCPGGCPTVDGGAPGTRALFAGRLFFAGRDAGHGVELWSSDGTAAGTRLVKDLCPGACDGKPSKLRVVGGHLVFLDAAGGFWSSDGTRAGTLRLAPSIVPADPLPVDAAGLGDGRVVFSGVDATDGRQPWVSDRTPGGTHPIAVLGGTLAASSQPSFLFPFGARVLFTACDGTTQAVWSSDGSEAGTFPLPGTDQPCDPASAFPGFQPADGLVFFIWKGRLWRTDATAGGTLPLLDLAGNADSDQGAAAGDKLLFPFPPPAFPPSSDGWTWEFWTSDGTLQGTREAFQLRLGGSPASFTSAGGEVLFIAASPQAPYPPEVWASDGTEAGTHVILSGSGLLLDAVRLGGRTYFLAAARSVGPELWSTDGTAAGTAPVLPDTVGARPRNPFSLVVFQNALCFYGEMGDPSHPTRGLWRSDGTAAGTVLVKALDLPRYDEAGHVLPPLLTPVGDQLFFRADDGVHGPELWKTDGTAAGTVLVRDVNPGPQGSRLADLTAGGGRLYFGATDGEHGYELWQSDGTAAGTTLVQDIQPGLASSNPDQLVGADGILYFTANDGEHGREPWALPLPR